MTELAEGTESREEARARRSALLARVREWIQEERTSGAEIARQLGKSSSTVNGIIRGDWPHRGACGWPLYFDRWLSSVGLNPEGRCVLHVLEVDGTPLLDYTLEVTAAEAERRNREWARTGRRGRWVPAAAPE